MLTFRFTGAKGEMTEPEILVSGMVGQQIRFVFSEEWTGLLKKAVYRAGPISCTREDIGEVDVIPEQVLSKALRRLYVGVCGTDEEGQMVIPTMFVPGPFIHIGASDSETPDPEDPGWTDFKQALEETVRFTPQELTDAQQAQARANLGIGELADCGWNPDAGRLLLALLRKAVFTQEVSGEILELGSLLALEEEPEVPDTPEEPETVYYSVVCDLDHVTAQPESELVEEGWSCTVVLMPEEGYVLDTLTVTMGGEDITASVLVEGGVSIPAVTGNVVITARAVEPHEPEIYPVTLSFTHVVAANNQRTVVEGECYVNVLLPDDDYELTTVKITMGGQDITQSVLVDKQINIPAVTGALFITAVAVEIPRNPVRYLSGSVYTNGGVAMINILNSSGANRFCCVASEVTADTPFPVNGNNTYGDLYLIAVPPEAAALKVTSPGYIGGPQFFTLVEGSYTRTIDAGWQTVNEFTYAITPGANQYVVLNFKKPDNSNFAFDTVDTSGFAIEFM